MNINAELIEMITLVDAYFNGDHEMTAEWFNRENLNFGGVAPAVLCRLGRAHKVLEFIRNASNGDIP